MALLGQWLVLLHVLAAFVLVAGLIGRESARAYAQRQTQMDLFAQLIGLSDWFESKLVIPGRNVTYAAWLFA